MCYHLAMPTRIVVNTSVFISVLIGPRGPSRELVRRCLLGDYVPLMGNALFLEYESVIGQASVVSQCPLSAAEITDLLAAFLNVSEWVNIYYLWRPNLRDEGDNHLIELAVAGNAIAIATHNIRDFQGANLLFPDLLITTPEQLLKE
jgi:putative PIN family toxin of toxin-antitoxin system